MKRLPIKKTKRLGKVQQTDNLPDFNDPDTLYLPVFREGVKTYIGIPRFTCVDCNASHALCMSRELPGERDKVDLCYECYKKRVARKRLK